MNRALKLFILLSVLSYGAHGQQDPVFSSDSSKVYKKPEIFISQVKPKAPKPIIHELSLGYRANTDGWSIYTDCGRVRTQDLKKSDMFHNLLYWQLEFTEKTNPKEQKVTSATPNKFGGSSSYKYGKINNLYVLKFGGGFRKMLAGKPDVGCVSIHWANTAGFALGLLKPYYINVSTGDPHAIKYTDITQSDFLDDNIILGSAGFSKGLDEIVFVPGGHIKTALHFDFSTNKKTVLAVETGVNAEFYSTPIQLMANQPAITGFYDIFIAFQIGKRW